MHLNDLWVLHERWKLRLIATAFLSIFILILVDPLIIFCSHFDISNFLLRNLFLCIRSSRIQSILSLNLSFWFINLSTRLTWCLNCANFACLRVFLACLYCWHHLLIITRRCWFICQKWVILLLGHEHLILQGVFAGQVLKILDILIVYLFENFLEIFRLDSLHVCLELRLLLYCQIQDLFSKW